MFAGSTHIPYLCLTTIFLCFQICFCPGLGSRSRFPQSHDTDRAILLCDHAVVSVCPYIVEIVGDDELGDKNPTPISRLQTNKQDMQCHDEKYLNCYTFTGRDPDHTSVLQKKVEEWQPTENYQSQQLIRNCTGPPIDHRVHNLPQEQHGFVNPELGVNPKLQGNVHIHNQKYDHLHEHLSVCEFLEHLLELPQQQEHHNDRQKGINQQQRKMGIELLQADFANDETLKHAEETSMQQQPFGCTVKDISITIKTKQDYDLCQIQYAERQEISESVISH